jgi:hypothetical protein
MWGFSGLPKFRLFVVPRGSAPTQARFAAHSSTASTVPRYGSAATRRPLPSMETASPAPDGRARTAASASAGRRTVRPCTIQSYCWNSGSREARFGEPSRASSASRGVAPSSSTRGGGAYSGAAAGAGSRSYSGQSSTSAATGMSPTTSPRG